MIVQFEGSARQEYRDAVRYSERRFGLGEALAQAVEAAVQIIVDDPEQFQPVGDGVRIFRLKRFPYHLYYQHDAAHEVIVIYALAHHSRRPDYWRKRKRG